MNKLPQIYGCELESAITDEYGKDIKPELLDPRYYLHGDNNGFYDNGFRIYRDNKHLEFATPECRGIREISAYTRAAEQQLIHIAKSGASRSDEDNFYVNGDSWVIHRRVLDRNGESWGVHDNFYLDGYDTSRLQGEEPDRRTTRALAWILAARSVISGAGSVQNGKFYISQKIPTIKSWNIYQHTSSIFRIPVDSDEQGRLEIRCSDDNIFDRPTRLRYAVVSFAVATGLLENLETELVSNDSSFLEDLRQSQEVIILPTGQIEPSEGLERHYTILKRLASLSMTLCKTEDLGEDYMWAAYEIEKQANKFGALLDGHVKIEELALLGTEWAVKLLAIQRDMQKRDLSASSLDSRSTDIDIRFSTIKVPKAGDLTYGWGFKYRDLGVMDPISADETMEAVNKPPHTTRAYDRVKYIRNGGHNVHNWGIVDRDTPYAYYNPNPGKRLLS